jgi:hypothetical protein
VIYQKIFAAYANPNRHHEKRAMNAVIDSIRRCVPAGLDEIAQLGRTLWRDAMTSWRSSPPTPPTDPPKPSTDASKPSVETPSDSATSPTTDCAHYCRGRTPPRHQCTLNDEEPYMLRNCPSQPNVSFSTTHDSEASLKASSRACHERLVSVSQSLHRAFDAEVYEHSRARTHNDQ